MYSAPPVGLPEPFVLTTFAPQCLGLANQAGVPAVASSQVWSGANLAIFHPFTLTTPRTYVGMIWVNGATVAATNVNGAVYSADGTTALATIGSVAQAGATATQQKAFPAPVTLAPGTYFMALVLDTGTGTLVCRPTSALILRAHGVRQLTSFFALTASAAGWSGMANARLYCFGLYEASWL